MQTPGDLRRTASIAPCRPIQAEVREHSGVRQSWALALLPRGLWRQQIASPLLGLKQGLLGSPLRDLAVVTA
jgi:hypothetical protein